MKTNKSKTPTARTPKPKRQRRSYSSLPGLVQHRIDRRRFVEFPGMKGRMVEKIEFFTMSDYHGLTIYFQDKTFLSMVLEPTLLIDAHFSDISSGDERVVRRWPTVRGVTSQD